MKFPTLASNRLRIGPLGPDDAQTLYEYRSHEAVARFQGWRPETLEQARAFIIRNGDTPYAEPGSWSQLAIRRLDSNQLIGDLGVQVKPGPGPQVEFGITIAPSVQRTGLGSEAARTLLHHLFDDLEAHRVVASVDPNNTPCLALLGRIGMRQEAHHRRSLLWRGEWVDDIVFAALRSEWS